MKQTRSKYIQGFAVMALAMSAPVFMPGNVSAETISITQELHVTAKVLPMRHIIVDRAGNIIEITSNTPDEVEPEVFLLADKPANKQKLTSEIKDKFADKVPAGTSRPGILYQSKVARLQSAGSAVSGRVSTWSR